RELARFHKHALPLAPSHKWEGVRALLQGNPSPCPLPQAGGGSCASSKQPSPCPLPQSGGGSCALLQSSPPPAPSRKREGVLLPLTRLARVARSSTSPRRGAVQTPR